jgi:hypothetical protein
VSESAPLVSVVLPAYDAADTVAEAAASILGQTLREIELIVVDDGSTDETARVLAGIDDRRLVLLRHGENRGHVAALQTAIDRARAPVIARMDADDVALPERLARQHDVLQRRPAVGLVSTAYVSVDPDGASPQVHGVPPDHAAVWFRLHFTNCLGHPTVMFRRHAYDAVGGYDVATVPAEDHDLWLRFADQVEIATIAEPLLRYRRSPQSVSGLDPAQTRRASAAVAMDAIERTVGRRPSPRIVDALRGDDVTLPCADVSAMVDVVVPVYAALGRACSSRGIATGSLPGQLASVLVHGGLRGRDGTWCRKGVARLVTRYPKAAAALARARASARAT